jgi:hypothetical protein
MSDLTPGEKLRIYEEEKERARAKGKIEKEKLAKDTKGLSTGCAVIIAVVAVIIGYILLTPPEKGSSAKKKPLFSATEKANVIAGTQKAQANGLIKKLDVRAGKAWIEDLTWASIDSEVKENMTRTLAAYCAIQKDTAYLSVEIMGWQSGKKLGSYTSFSGFKVY